MNKEQKFRLRTSVQQWSREYHAPFIRPLYKALLEHYQTHHSGVNWNVAIAQARADFIVAKRWGEMTCKQRSVRLYVDGLNIELSCATAAWALIFPDYLLVTYPTFPIGRAGKLSDEWSHSCNPFYWQPSHLWHLPEHVYLAMEGEYGPRKKEALNPKKYEDYYALRKTYCEYFCKSYNLNPEVLTPIINKARPTLHIASIFEVN
jgi:hypothetical protein